MLLNRPCGHEIGDGQQSRSVSPPRLEICAGHHLKRLGGTDETSGIADAWRNQLTCSRRWSCLPGLRMSSCMIPGDRIKRSGSGSIYGSSVFHGQSPSVIQQAMKGGVLAERRMLKMSLSRWTRRAKQLRSVEFCDSS